MAKAKSTEGLIRTKGWQHTVTHAYVYSAHIICCSYVEAAKYDIAS